MCPPVALLASWLVMRVGPVGVMVFVFAREYHTHIAKSPATALVPESDHVPDVGFAAPASL